MKWKPKIGETYYIPLLTGYAVDYKEMKGNDIKRSN